MKIRILLLSLLSLVAAQTPVETPEPVSDPAPMETPEPAPMEPDPTEPPEPAPSPAPMDPAEPAPRDPDPTRPPEPAPEPDPTEPPEPDPEPAPTKPPTRSAPPPVSVSTNNPPPVPDPTNNPPPEATPVSAPVAPPTVVAAPVAASVPVYVPNSPSGDLEVVGDNGSPSSVFPLGRCQGDCDNDSNCAGNLVCYERHSNNQNHVPGCNGTPSQDTDYCVRQEDLPDSSHDLETVDNDDDLERCQGDCDNDNDCSGDLVCYHVGNNDNHVPGCNGTPNEDTDYCVRPEDDPYQLDIVNDDKDFERCQGDCDNDNDCSGDLVCYNVGNNDNHVPGCRGTPNEDTDYCVRPEDDPDQLEPEPSPSPNQTPTSEYPSLTPTVSHAPSISHAPTISSMPTVSNETGAVLLGGASTGTSSVQSASSSASSPTWQSRVSSRTGALLGFLVVTMALL